MRTLLYLHTYTLYLHTFTLYLHTFTFYLYINNKHVTFHQFIHYSYKL